MTDRDLVDDVLNNLEKFKGTRGDAVYALSVLAPALRTALGRLDHEAATEAKGAPEPPHKLTDEQVLVVWNELLTDGEPYPGEVLVHNASGGVYVADGFTLDSGTCEPLLNYISLKTGVCWTRPLKEFDQEVEVAGKSVRRFRVAGGLTQLNIPYRQEKLP